MKYYTVTYGPRRSYLVVVHKEGCGILRRTKNAHQWDRNPLDDKGYHYYQPCRYCKPTATKDEDAQAT